MSRRLTSAQLVGREDAVDQILGALESARNGDARHILVSGEAGVGKTRLLTSVAERASGEGTRILVGGCINLGEAGMPFAPFTEIMRTLITQEGAAEVATLVGRATPDLARLVPALGSDDAAPPQGSWAQTRLYDALRELLHRLSRQAPLYLQLEDLHWADAGTLAATSFLLNSIRDEPIVIVATYRSDEVTRRHPLRPWLAEAGRSDRVERIDLKPLSEAEAAVLIRNITGTEHSARSVADIHRRSDGNPYFVEELLASGVDSERELPATLRDVLLARVDALEPSAQDLLSVAAVGGREVEHEALLSVVGDPDSSSTDIRALVDGGLLVPTLARDRDGYAFRHALLQEAVYDAMLPTERRRLHQAWGELLADVDSTQARSASHLVELSYHWRCAHDGRALKASIEAGDAALAAFSFDIAAREFEEALSLWQPSDVEVGGIDHVDLLWRVALSWYSARGDRRALSACREAILENGDGDPVRSSELHVLLGRVLWVMGEWGASTGAYEEALRIAPAEPADTRTRALAGLGQVYMLNGEFARSRPLCEEAVERARKSGSRELEGHGLNTLGVDLTGLGMIDEGTAAMQAALEIALALGHPEDIGRAYVNTGDTLMWAGRQEEAIATAERGIEAVGRLGMALTYGTYIRLGLVYCSFISGRWDLAAHHLVEADRALSPVEGSDQYRSVYAIHYLAASGAPSAPHVWEQTRRRLADMPPSEHTGQFYVGGVELAALDDRPEDAADIGFAGLDIVLSGIDAWIRSAELARMTAWPVADLGVRARAGGDSEALKSAEERMERLSAIAADAPGHLGKPSGHLGRLLALDGAQIDAERQRLKGLADPGAWQDVAGEWTDLGQPYRAMYALWRTAEATEVAGDRDRASELVRDTHARATALGAEPLAAHLAQLARRMRVRLGGTRPVSATTAGPAFGLTPREQEVLELVARGRTNKQVAEELFISQSTAGVHVSNILAKLGVSSRTEAASVALSQGLVQA